MLWNYLKIAVRNISKNKIFSLINISGFSFGIAAGILILVFVWTSLSLDSYHTNAENIHLVYKVRKTPTGDTRVLDTWLPMLPELKKTYPGIVEGVRMFDWDNWVRRGNRKFQENVTYADASIFRVFDFKLLKGNPDQVFSEKNSVVITDKIAQKYFGPQDPMGQTLNLDFKTDFKVTGILDELPQNSSIQFEMLANFEGADHIPLVKRTLTSWGTSYLYTYVQLDPRVTVASLHDALPAFVKTHWSDETAQRMHLALMPLTAITDEIDSTDSYAYILFAIALAILLIASINFMNLTTARSIYRAREIGMRKVLGADRVRLVTQFLCESLLVTCLALLIGIGLAYSFLPVFNEFVGMELSLNPGEYPQYVAGLAGLTIFVGVASGAYPALYLSGFKPVETLKNEYKAGKSRLRFVLVVLQFCLSAILITATGIIYQQTRFMKEQNLNFDKNNVIVFNTALQDFENPQAALQKLETLKRELRSTTGVLSVSTTSSIPGDYMGSHTMIRPRGSDDNNPLRMRYAVIDEHYLETFGLKLSEGRNFSKEISSDTRDAVMLNQAALRAIGWNSIEDKAIMFGDAATPVIGAIQDFNFQSLSQPIEPVVHFMLGDDNPRNRFVSVKVEGSRVQPTLDLMKQKWGEIDPTRELEFFFADDNFDRQYRSEEGLTRIVGYCTLLAIVIACLGLLGLASFTVVQRTKEIGIRKVLGASTTGIVSLLVRQFIVPILVANAIAWPIAYILMNMWLQNYAYKTEIGIGIFALTTIFILVIAITTVSSQTIRAALQNPVKTLQYE